MNYFDDNAGLFSQMMSDIKELKKENSQLKDALEWEVACKKSLLQLQESWCEEKKTIKQALSQAEKTFEICPFCKATLIDPSRLDAKLLHKDDCQIFEQHGDVK